MNTPINSEALPPFPKHAHVEAFALMKYVSADGHTVEMIWNSQDRVTPFCVLAKDGKTELRHTDWKRDEYRPDHQLKPGDRYFGPITREAAERYAEARMKQLDGTEFELQGEARAELQSRVLESMLNDETPDLLIYSENDRADLEVSGPTDATCSPSLDCPREELVAYIKSMKGGERVMEMGESGMKGETGTVEIRDSGVCIRWDTKFTEGSGMVTSFTGGARKISDENIQGAPAAADVSPLSWPDSDGWWWCRQPGDGYLPGDELCVEVTLESKFNRSFITWNGESYGLEDERFQGMEWIKAASPWQNDQTEARHE